MNHSVWLHAVKITGKEENELLQPGYLSTYTGRQDRKGGEETSHRISFFPQAGNVQYVKGKGADRIIKKSGLKLDIENRVKEDIIILVI